MLHVYAQLYVEIGRILQMWMAGVEVIAAPLQNLNIKEYRQFIDDLQAVGSHCSVLNLGVTGQLVTDTFAILNNAAIGASPRRDEVANKMGEIHRCMIAELKSKLLFYIPDNRARFVHLEFVEATDMAPRPAFFGAELKGFEPAIQSFPSIKYDVNEAGNCYVAGRNTACVFHLMRILETGLGALGGVFGVSLLHTNWAPALEQIESKIRDMHKDPTWKALPDYKEQQEFYAQAASHFGILKDAWRNYTAHNRGRYDEDEAVGIFRNVRGFMQKLATRLHE